MDVLLDFVDPGRLCDGDLSLALLEQIPANPEKGWVPYYHFGMMLDGIASHVGTIDLRLGATAFMVTYGGQVGYGVEPAFRRRRLAARSLCLLRPLARRHGLSPLWITCDPDNMASRRTCELAGAVLVGVVDLPSDCDMYRDGDRYRCRYRLQT